MMTQSSAKSAAAALLILILCACEAARSSTEERSEKLLQAFLADWESKSPRAKTHYAPDAVMVVTDAPPRRGMPAISQSFDRFAADKTAKFDATNAVTVMSAGGDIAYSQGTYTLEESDPRTGKLQRSNGYYLLVHKKQPDGSWKIVQDVSSRLP